MSAGYIKLWRKLQDNQIWTAEPFTRGQAWVDLLMLANHKDGHIRVRGNRVEVRRGQVGWSHVALAARWQWSRGKVRRFLSELEKTVQQIVQQKNNVTSLITIINYDEYQGNGTADGTADGQQTVQQTDSRRYTNKNDKNEKNVKNDKNEKKTDRGSRALPFKKKFEPPTEDEVIAYFEEKGYTSEAAIKAHQYYDAADWKDSRGNQVKNWKQKMIAVWFKQENKKIDCEGKKPWHV